MNVPQLQMHIAWQMLSKTSYQKKKKRKMTQNQKEPLKLLCLLEGSKNQEGGENWGQAKKGPNIAFSRLNK